MPANPESLEHPVIYQKPKEETSLSLKERFDPLHKESQPGYRVIDDSADRISFSCNRNDFKKGNSTISV